MPGNNCGSLEQRSWDNANDFTASNQLWLIKPVPNAADTYTVQNIKSGTFLDLQGQLGKSNSNRWMEGNKWQQPEVGSLKRIFLVPTGTIILYQILIFTNYLDFRFQNVASKSNYFNSALSSTATNISMLT
ncbi:hypothetical protein D9757_006398 [Collybiopsis confluens]|uniref:Ricin B lectin domain-containing protein n=1 Tax=Collybiopsis confluens TaxID=2823264 RepID=A0A8H5M7V5_9AGAR|nr:hypothetical protein D9757_006398 [Collybiopsis confluens]